MRSIQRTADALAAAIENMCINHGCTYILMPQKLLDGSDIIPILQQMGSKGMPESMTTDRLVNVR